MADVAKVVDTAKTVGDTAKNVSEAGKQTSEVAKTASEASKKAGNASKTTSNKKENKTNKTGSQQKQEGTSLKSQETSQNTETSQQQKEPEKQKEDSEKGRDNSERSYNEQQQYNNEAYVEEEDDDERYRAKSNEELLEEKRAQQEHEKEVNKDAKKQLKDDTVQAYADSTELAAGILSKIPYTAPVGEAINKANDLSGGMISKASGHIMYYGEKVGKVVQKADIAGAPGTKALTSRTARNVLIGLSKTGAVKGASTVLGSGNSGKELAGDIAKKGVEAAGNAVANSGNKDEVSKKRREMVIEDFFKDIWDAIPLLVKIPLFAILIIGFVVLMIFFSLGKTGEQKGFNRYDYNQYIIISNDNEYSLDDYVLSALYLDFFIRNDIISYGLSDDEFQNAVKAYSLYIKTTVLKRGGYSVDNESHSSTLSNDINGYPSMCDIKLGCYAENQYKTYDQDVPFESKQYPGLFEYQDGTIENQKAELIFTAVNDISSLLIAPSSLNSAISVIDSNYEVPDLNKDTFEQIITLAQEGKDYEEIVQEYAKSINEDYDVKVYDINDYIIDESIAYVNIGFWWPIGSLDLGKDNLYSNEPAYTLITDSFGWRYSKDGELVKHNGIDIPTGGNNNSVPVLAVADGIVTEQYCQAYNDKCLYDQTSNEFGGGGCQIEITHSNRMVTRYLHLSEESYNAYVKKGDRVTKGQMIGKVGSTGCSTGPHLHFEIRVDGNPINPLNYVSKTNPRPQGDNNE